MLVEVVFVLLRLFELAIIIPTMGMLAWFVDAYNRVNALTPASILVLFIVSVLALAWCLLSLLIYHHHPTTARIIALVDVLFIGAFIAGVYYLRGIRHADCSNVSRSGTWDSSAGGFTVSGPSLSVDIDKSCAMLKASWAFGIICCLVFPISALAALHYSDRAFSHRRHRKSSSRRSSTRRVYV
jgi:sugar phosphate permease